jgi:threonine/homoserine efflux transporter RhtA
MEQQETTAGGGTWGTSLAVSVLCSTSLLPRGLVLAGSLLFSRTTLIQALQVNIRASWIFFVCDLISHRFTPCSIALQCDSTQSS